MFWKPLSKYRCPNGLDFEFIFHNVGHGLFYSGKLRFGSDVFNFIYDCGSRNDSLIRNAVNSYIYNSLEEPRIDLIILSHIDMDHVNGLKYFFSNKIQINTVILPYFTPLERLIIALAYPYIPNWYLEFLADPVTFLVENNIRRIILIGGGKGGEENREGIEPNRSPSDDRNYIDLDGLRDDLGLKRFIIQAEPLWKNFMNKKRLLVKSHHGKVSLISVWLMKFFYYPLEPSVLNMFKKCVDSIMPNLSNDPSKIKKLIKENKLTELKECYKNLPLKPKLDINDTSLVLYHMPRYRFRSRGYLTFTSSNSSLTTYRYSDIFSRFGQLLTGDINLSNKRVYKNLKNHFKNLFHSVVLGMVPHHGSRRSWNSQILKDTPNSEIWVISTDLRNKKFQIHFALYEILTKGRIPLIVNEYNSIRIKGYFRL